MVRLNKKGNTRVITERNTTSVILHQTTIVKFDRKKIVLNSGGWWTSTTKARMNQAAQEYDLGFSIYQRNFKWYIRYDGEVIPFEDIIKLKR